MLRKHISVLPKAAPLYGVLIISILLNVYLLVTKSPRSQGVKVAGVIDGDTIVLEGKVRVRLRHADAPEAEYCGGKEAKKELEKLVLGKHVLLDEQIPDQLGRGMALVYDGNILINGKMIQSGWARYHSDSTSKKEELQELSVQAKEQKKGVYGKCMSTDNTEKPECNIKGNIDKNKYTDNKKYYIPGCAQYNFTVVELDTGEGWFCTEAEARKAGFVKAETCRE